MGLFSSSSKKSLNAFKLPGAELPRSRLSQYRSASGNRDAQLQASRSNPFINLSPASVPRPSSHRSSEPIDAPPAYSPEDTLSPAYSAPTMAATSDSPYAFLGQFDTIFLIDDSGSMAGRSWRETENALSAITPVCTSHDADGVDIYFLNHRNVRGGASSGAYTKITSPTDVREIFTTVSPRGATPTGARLGHILNPYMNRLETTSRVNPAANIDTIVRPLNIIVITDGIPSDDVESVIVNAARKLDKMNAQPWQVGIQFFQVGNEPEAAEELRELDDSLSDQKAIRDMVDTVPYNAQNGVTQTLTGEAILKVVLGSVHRKYDRRNALGRRERSTQRG